MFKKLMVVTNSSYKVVVEAVIVFLASLVLPFENLYKKLSPIILIK